MVFEQSWEMTFSILFHILYDFQFSIFNFQTNNPVHSKIHKTINYSIDQLFYFFKLTKNLEMPALVGWMVVEPSFQLAGQTSPCSSLN